MTVTALLLLTGCGQDAPAPAVDRSPTSAATPTAPPSQTATPTETGPAPATGVTITSSSAPVNAPAGWMTNPNLSDTGGNVNGPNGNASYNVLLSDAALSLSDNSTDYSAQLARRSCCYKPPLKRRPDITLDGRPPTTSPATTTSSAPGPTSTGSDTRVTPSS